MIHCCDAQLDEDPYGHVPSINTPVSITCGLVVGSRKLSLRDMGGLESRMNETMSCKSFDFVTSRNSM